MPRTTDDLADGERFQPLGPPIRTPATPKPDWRPREGSPGIYENAEGKVRTDMPPPFVPPTRVP